MKKLTEEHIIKFNNLIKEEYYNNRKKLIELRESSYLRLLIKYILNAEYREMIEREKNEKVLKINREEAIDLFYYLQSNEFERDCNYTHKTKEKFYEKYGTKCEFIILKEGKIK